MLSRDKGNFGEAVAKKEMIKLGYTVLEPTSDHTAFDFVAYKDSVFIKIQVKLRALVNGAVSIGIKKNCFYNAQGLKQNQYTKNDWDWLLVVDPETEKVYKLTWDDFGDGEAVSLRVAPPKNNQKQRIRLAEHYELKN